MLLIVHKFSFPKRDMSESYLVKGVSHLNQLPLEQHIEGAHTERLSCCTATVHILNSLETQVAPHSSQDSFEHPLLPSELWLLSNIGRAQSVHLEKGGRERRAHLENAGGFSPYPFCPW